MAMNKVKNDSDLLITVQVVTKPDGAPMFKKYRFSKIKPDAEDQKIFEVANEIAHMLKAPLHYHPLNVH